MSRIPLYFALTGPHNNFFRGDPASFLPPLLVAAPRVSPLELIPNFPPRSPLFSFCLVRDLSLSNFRRDPPFFFSTQSPPFFFRSEVDDEGSFLRSCPPSFPDYNSPFDTFDVFPFFFGFFLCTFPDYRIFPSTIRLIFR